MTLPVEFGYAVESKNSERALYKQVHGDVILDIPSVEIAQRFALDPPAADGAVTTDPSLRLDVSTADCIPLLFFGLERTAPIAAVHCGWRGALAGIAKKAVATLTPMTSTLHVAVGPCILACCFEVKDDFIDAFRAKDRNLTPYLHRRDGRTYCDLIRFVRFEELGQLPDERFLLRDLRCTVCSTPRLPSYRRDRGTDPRLRSWIRKSS